MLKISELSFDSKLNPRLIQRFYIRDLCFVMYNIFEYSSIPNFKLYSHNIRYLENIFTSAVSTNTRPNKKFITRKRLYTFLSTCASHSIILQNFIAIQIRAQHFISPHKQKLIHQIIDCQKRVNHAESRPPYNTNCCGQSAYGQRLVRISDSVGFQYYKLIRQCRSGHNAILKCIRPIIVVGYWQFITVGRIKRISSDRNNSATTNKFPPDDIYHARIMVINDFLYDAFVSRFSYICFRSRFYVSFPFMCAIFLWW